MVLCGVSPHPIGLVDFYLILEMSCSRAFHQTLISSQPQALSPATRRVIIKPAGRHTQTDASSSGPDALIQPFSEHSQPRPGARVVCPAPPPSRNRLGQRALRNLLGVLARRTRKDALELRLHQRLSGRVVPDEGGNQCSSMVISGTCRLASYRRHVLNEPHRRAATCGLNLSSASTCESVLIGALRGRQ